MNKHIYIVSWIEQGYKYSCRHYSLKRAKQCYKELEEDVKRCNIRQLYLSKVIN